MNDSERLVKRLSNDIGGLPGPAIVQTDHPLEPWEKRCHALADVLDFRKIINTGEKRCCVEALGSQMISHLSYYERWIVVFSNILLRKQILTPTDIALKNGRRRSAVDHRVVVVTQVLARSGGGTVVSRSRGRNGCKVTASLWMSLVVSSVVLAVPTEDPLVEPVTVIVDRSLPKRVVAEEIQAARRYATFWSSGKESLARAALSPDFMDRTLPDGRPQGTAGPIAASATVHAAIPDIRCDIEQLIVARDRVVVHLHFSGHFTGEFKGMPGHGQSIHFIATDIYRIVDGRIAENWHLEDNLALLEQLGVITH